MRTDGLGEYSSFGERHPAVTTVYFALVIGITMFSGSPLFLLLSFLWGFAYEVILKGKKSVRGTLILAGVILLMSGLINMFFTHNGSTVLFYMGTNRVTLEALLYGWYMALMIIAVIVWFSCCGVIQTSDKLIYIFGRFAPVLGLTVSMIFRFIPLLRHRFSEIEAGQKAMGRGELTRPVKRLRQFAKEVSILISWSLEASIESADSMAARGYGLKGRTSFHLFRFEKRDLFLLLLVLAASAAAAGGLIAGAFRFYFYPEIRPVAPALSPVVKAGSLACFVLLLSIPAAIDLLGEYQWKRSGSQI